MGYESRVYVVNKTSMMDGDNKRYGQIVAMFDICKFNGFDGIFKTETDCYIYADDGDTQITKDKYGDPLKEATIDEVINYLEKFAAKQKPYRRVTPLLELLKGFDPSEWEDLIVIHYGY